MASPEANRLRYATSGIDLLELDVESPALLGDYFSSYSSTAAIYVVQSGKFASSGATNAVNITLPDTPTVGNELLLAVAYLTFMTLATPSGWTLVDQYEFNGVGIALFRRTVVGGDGTNWTPTVTSGSDFLGAAILEIYGGDLSAAQIGNNSTNGSSSHATASVTPGTIPTLPLIFASQDDAAAAGSDAVAVPTGWTAHERAFPDYHSLYAFGRDNLTTDTSTGITATLTGVNTGSDFSTTIILIPQAAGGGSALNQNLNDTATATDSHTATITKVLADTVTASESSTKAPTLNKADTVTATEAVAKAPLLNKSDSVTSTDAATKTTTLGKSDTVSPTDSVVKSTTLNKADSATVTDALANTPTKSLADGVTASEAHATTLSKVLADSVASSEAIANWLTKNLADSVSTSDADTRAIALVRGDTVAVADAAAKTAGLSKSDVATVADAIAKALTKPISDSVTTSDEETGTIVLRLVINDSVGASDSQAASVAKNLADSVSAAELVGKTLAHYIADSVGASDQDARNLSKALADGVSLTDAITKTMGKYLSDSVATSELLDAAFPLFYSLADIVVVSDQIRLYINGQKVAWYRRDDAAFQEDASGPWYTNDPQNALQSSDAEWYINDQGSFIQ